MQAIDVEENLRSLGYTLPVAAKPSFNYVPGIVKGDLVYIAGQLPKEGEEVKITGRCGENISVEEAQRAAVICTLQGLACAAETVGGLNNLSGVLRVTGFVASTPDFHEQPKILDACSGLLVDIFADAGRHVRSAVGVAALPRRAPVEIEFIFTKK